MSETIVRPAWGPAQCGCGCRPEGAHQSGCGCPECQPGPGIDHLAGAGAREVARRARLKELLLIPDSDLTPEEAEELDEILHWTVHRMS